MIKIRYAIVILFSFLIIFNSCTTDSTITGNSNKAIAKPTDVLDINSPNTGNDELTPLEYYMQELVNWILKSYLEAFLSASNQFQLYDNLCYQLFDSPDNEDDHEEYNETLSKSYDFRDNYLSNSEKGEVYTACYYLLSKYGIENNLVNKYYKEHHELIKSSVNVARQLQYGNYDDKILIKDDIANKLEIMVNIYRSHQNHRDIDPILDYLEYELNKYQNKPKSVISADFK